MDALFSPTRIGLLELPNRFAVAPMTRVSATAQSHATGQMARYYRRFAERGFGMVITEGIYTDQAYSQGYLFQPGLSQRRAGAVLVRRGRCRARRRRQNLRAADARWRTSPGQPLPQPFGRTVSRAAYTNRRSDEWGGATENRIRLHTMVIEAARRAVGARVPVGIRISQAKVNDCLHKWAGESDARTVFGALAAAGADFIHVIELEAWKPAFGNDGPSLAQLARQFAPGLPMIANGGLQESGRAAQLLHAGADIIAIGRGALSNHCLPLLLAEGAVPAPFDPALLSPLGDIKEIETSAVA